MAQKKSNKKTLVLLDAHAILHRAYHALPPFTSPEGMPTGALYGFASMILKIIRELQPDYIAAAYDVKEPTFRHIAYEAYKGTRAKTDDELIAQFDISRDLLGALHIPSYSKEGFEADDIIGTFVKKLKKEKDLSIIIASGDLDALQLVEDKKVQVYTLRKGIQDTVLYDEDGVHERFGFAPSLLRDFKGLRGDPSDNIPGVVGIGEKTATDLIVKFGTLERILSLAKKDPGQLKKAGVKDRIIGLLRDQQEKATFSKELATIKCDVSVSFALEDMAYTDGISDEGIAFFKKLGFTSILSRLPGKEYRNEKKNKPIVRSVPVWKKIMNASALYWALLGEGVALVTEDGSASFFSREELTREKDKIRALFSGKILHRAFDAKKMMHMLAGFGVTALFEDDIHILFWLKDPQRTDPSLEDLLALFGRATKEASLPDCGLLPSMYASLAEEIQKKDLMRVYREIEMPLVPILFLMEKEGIGIDTKALSVLGVTAEKDIKKLEKEIYALAGESFLINSPKELGRILFGVLGISAKGIKKTGTGQRSTRFSELTKLQGAHPIIEKIIAYREVGKIYSTYISVLPDLAGKDGRIHTTFHQTGAVTGRLSSSDPNMQNIPTRSLLGDDIRRAFIAKKGRVFLACDYSQIQLRIAALLSGEKKMLSVFKRGEDIHSVTASLVFGVGEHEITPEMRRRAKVINFGILYGMGVQALAENLKVSRDEASLFLSNYFRQYPKLFEYFERVKDHARSKGYVETLFGRKRFLPDIHSHLFRIQREAERMAMNAPIQGGEADMIKKAMSGVNAFVAEDPVLRGRVRMLLQIHDELLFEVDEDVLDDAIQKIPSFLETVYPNTDVDFPVETKIGPNWADLTP